MFAQNFQITLEVSGILAYVANIHYLCMLLRGEALHQLDMLYAEVGSTTTDHLNLIILGLGTYVPPFDALSKQKRAMRRKMRKPQGLRVRLYNACLIDINEYLATFLGEKSSDKICEAELNEILLNSMPNRWSRQAPVQGFYCESINLKKYLIMF